MNYRHDYHAGNFADIFKHIVLTLLLTELKKKEAPFFYLDLHGGKALYDLTAKAPQNTQEYLTGIGKIWESKQNAPSEIAPFIQSIDLLNPSTLRYYPGSSVIAHNQLRDSDRMWVNDLNSVVYQNLNDHFKNIRNVTVSNEDAYTALIRLVPPKEKRGIVLIDPPFEQPDEMQLMIRQLKKAYQRWATGCYTLWFPIKSQPIVHALYRKAIATEIKKILAVEFYLYPHDVSQRLSGCGMLIINPPWQIDMKLKKILKDLLKRLGAGQKGEFKVFWLTNENN